MPCDFGPKQLKLKRSDVRVRTRGDLTALVWKDRWEVYMLNEKHGPTTSRWKFLWWQQPHCETSHRGTVQPAHGLCQQFQSYDQQLFNELMYLQVDHEIVFPPSGSNSWILSSSCGVKTPTIISGSFWWGIWFNELEKAKIAPPPEWLEDQVQPQQTLRDLRVIITNPGQWNLPPNSAAFWVRLTARKMARCLRASDVTWACAWCLVLQNITLKLICK